MVHPEADQDEVTMTNGHVSPSVARRRLAEEMRSAREAAGLRLSDAAARIQRSAPTLSRIETNRSLPRLVDVKALLDLYEEQVPAAVPPGARDRIIQLAEIAREAEWFSTFRDVLSGDLTAADVQRFVEYESDATKIWSFQPELVPGILQTRRYAEAVTSLFFPDRKPADRARFVEFRLARQHVLNRQQAPLELDVVIGEAVLRRVVGSADVMREQIRAVLDNVRNGQRNVRIRIAPIALSVPAVFGGPFLVMDLPGDDDPGLVYLEGRAGATYVQSAPEVARYRKLIEDLDEAVLDREGSQALLEEVLKDLG